MDVFLVKKANSLASSNEWLEFAVVALAEYLPYILAFSLITVIVWPGVSRKFKIASVIALLAGLFARYFVKTFIGFFYIRPRPATVFGDVTPLVELGSLSSFPSGHALFFFALATVIFLYNRKAGWIFFAGAVLAGTARVFAGIHYPTDILGGAILGILAALAVYWFMHKFVLSD